VVLMNRARVFFGAVVTAIGAVLLLDYAGVGDAGTVIGRWWPLVIILAGVLAYSANPRYFVGPLIITAVGVTLLLRTTGLVDTFAIIAPVLLIVIGLLVIFGRGFRRSEASSDDRIHSFNIFSGSELGSHSKRFEGGSIGALFGGVELDLRNAELAPGANIDAFVAFGGAEIKVPQGWRVVTKGMPIFGGFENVTAKEGVPDGAPRLEINATVLFGGLEIKH
jgi:hypothetical protein